MRGGRVNRADKPTQAASAAAIELVAPRRRLCFGPSSSSAKRFFSAQISGYRTFRRLAPRCAAVRDRKAEQDQRESLMRERRASGTDEEQRDDPERGLKRAPPPRDRAPGERAGAAPARGRGQREREGITT